MRALLICTLLLSGCSKKSDTSSEPASGAKDEAPAGAPAQPAPEAPTPEAPAEKPVEPAPAEPAAEAPAVDCAALVTAEDVAKACGGAKVDVADDESPIKTANTVCARKVTAPGKKFPIARVHVLAFSSDAGADGWVKLDKVDDAKDVAGIGDLAWTRVKERPQLKSTDYDVGVRKGRVVLKLGMTKNSLNKNPPCTIEQLTELARAIAPRMP